MADAAAISAVNVETWRVAYRGLVPDDYLAGRSAADREPKWRRLLEPGSGCHTLVATVDHVVAGYCSLALPSRDQDTGPDVAEVTSIYVLPEHQGSGIGRALMTAGLEHVRGAVEFEQVTLWVFSANQAAQAFYRQLGFSADGARTPDPVLGIEELRMRRSVA